MLFALKACRRCEQPFRPTHPRNCHCSFACRFWGHVDIQGPDDCWPFTGAIGTHGYGVTGNKPEGRPYITSNVAAWELANGERVPLIFDEAGKKIEVCHSCHNRPCCNPAHLSLGTRSDNAQQMHDAGRHPWSKAA